MAVNPAFQPFKPELPCFTSDGSVDADDFIREARLRLTLVPMANNTAAGWFLNFLEGRVRQEIIQRQPDQVNTPEKILAIIQQNRGEQRTTSDMATAFFS